MFRSVLRLAGLFILPYRDHTGKKHWLAQRISAVALLPLYAWLLLLAFPIASTAQHDEFLLWMQDPVNATLVCLVIVFSLHHMVHGLEVIIEDYIATPLLNKIALFCVRWGVFGFELVVLAAIFHILWLS